MSGSVHVPLRQCAACGRRDAQARLARFALRDGQVAWDRERRLPGRGAYLHLEDECVTRFARQKPFVRSLRASVASEDRQRLASEARMFTLP
ncbi:MAG: YlxR family protein [Candidatus Binatia bacterium]